LTYRNQRGQEVQFDQKAMLPHLRNRNGTTINNDSEMDAMVDNYMSKTRYSNDNY